MFSHVTLGTNDLARAKVFYEPVMAALSIPVPFAMQDALVFGQAAGPKLFIVHPFDKAPAHHGNGGHVALNAASRYAVDAFYAAALANGGTDEGPPGLRPNYHRHYYAAYVRDPDGNKLQAVCHHAPAGAAARTPP